MEKEVKISETVKLEDTEEVDGITYGRFVDNNLVVGTSVGFIFSEHEKGSVIQLEKPEL